MDDKDYGPLRYLIGNWESEGLTGQNVAPDPDREREDTRFRQTMSFEPIGKVENHEQLLFALRYRTKAWEEGRHGSADAPFHEEVGYFIWDAENRQVMKSFIVPRGIAVNAGGTADVDSRQFKVSAVLGSPTYGLSSNPFLDVEFKTTRYDVSFDCSVPGTLKYDENTQLQIKGRPGIFDHTERNVLKRTTSTT